VSTREDIQALGKSLEHYADAVQRHSEVVTVEITKLWGDVAELRDELHALANRVESLTQSAATKQDLSNFAATYLPDRV